MTRWRTVIVQSEAALVYLSSITTLTACTDRYTRARDTATQSMLSCFVAIGDRSCSKLSRYRAWYHSIKKVLAICGGNGWQRTSEAFPHNRASHKKYQRTTSTQVWEKQDSVAISISPRTLLSSARCTRANSGTSARYRPRWATTRLSYHGAVTPFLAKERAAI